MKNFRRAVRESFQYFPAIVLATICSIGIAFLWGSNIGALYPVIDLTLKGESIQGWVQKSIDIHEAEKAAAKSELVLKTQNGNQSDDANARSAIRGLEHKIKQAETAIYYRRIALSYSQALLPRDPFQTICAIMGLLVVSTLVKHLLMLTNDLLLGYAASAIVRDLRRRVFAKALSMDRTTYQNHGTSGLLATITSAADSLAQGLMALFGVAIREPLRVVSCLIFASFISVKLLLLSAVLAPMLLLVVVFFNRTIRSISTSILGKNVGFHEILLEALNNIFTVQAFTMEKQENEKFEECTKDMRRISLKMIFYTGLSKPLTELIGVGMVAIAVCAGAYLVVNKQTHIGFLHIRDTPLSITDLLMFFGFLIGASDPLRKLSGVSIVIYGGAMASNMLYAVLDVPSNVTAAQSPEVLRGRGHRLSIQDLSFYYHQHHPVLQDVNLDIGYGSTVAILGPNGSGKSTLIHLLCRFYDPTGGRICLGNVDIKRLSLHDLRSRIAIVSQSTELFNRTVLENIQYGSPEATQEQVYDAAKLAHAHRFITESLSEGYETVVGQGGQKLSGGQRQRIALARAILRKPEILILDESTSQIDMESELQIRETLQQMKGSMTIIIITHREALTALADEVYTIQNGRLIPSQYKLAAA
jgi:ATP-binding cassette, subfamily B, bacterial MsbA